MIMHYFSFPLGLFEMIEMVCSWSLTQYCEIRLSYDSSTIWCDSDQFGCSLHNVTYIFFIEIWYCAELETNQNLI